MRDGSANRSVVLFEDDGFVDLLPLVFWRSVFELRIGRKIVLDRTAQRLGAPIAGVWTREWLATVAAQRCGAPANRHVDGSTVLINGRWLMDAPPVFPDAPAVGVADGRIAYIVCDAGLAERLRPNILLDPDATRTALDGVPRQEVEGRFFRYAWEIVDRLSALLEQEWNDNQASIESEIDTHLTLINRDRIHVGENTTIDRTAVIDASKGSIYISHDVRIGAYAVLEGPAYVGPGTHIMPHSWIHGGNAFGPVCRIGGELHQCVICGYTNKQHYGFLGHSFVGAWVNFGAGATNSDLKNTYGKVRVPLGGVDVDTGLQFFGATVADHVKIGINAAIPTGAVIGLAASVASTKLIPKYIPSFGWVTEDGVRRGDPARLLDVAVAAMARRNVEMTDAEVELMLDLGDRVREYEKPAR